jgi:4-hydroxy 2-oxovalerate aldolase
MEEHNLSKIQLLDCTLRDGGYINNWNFGFSVAKSLISSLIASNIDLVELGFLRDCTYDRDKTLFNNIAESKYLIPDNAENTKFTLMALYDKYTLNKLEDNDGTIFAIRVTFHNYDSDKGLEYIRRLKDKGYNVFCNPINVMGYSNTEFCALLDNVNRIHPYAFSIVDTFGSMRSMDLTRYLVICESELEKDIAIGCHLHENLSHSLSLAEEFAGCVQRNCVIDASLNGMGRVPGNLPIELIADSLNSLQQGSGYTIEHILEAIDNHILNIKMRTPWGYSPEYFLSARYNLHRNYAEYYVNKRNITFKSMDKLLAQIEPSKKASFDAAYADKLYYEIFSIVEDSFTTFKQIVKEKKILILAPGSKLINEKDRIKQYIIDNLPVTFGVNFVSEHFPDVILFFGNEKRFIEYTQQIKTNRNNIFITSNIDTDIANLLKINCINALCGIIDATNSVLMLLNLLHKAEVTEVSFAGLDGFDSKSSNFFDPLFNNRENLQNTVAVHAEMESKLRIISKKMKLHFVTESVYEKALRG